MDGETIDRHPGERARPGSPPGWYADPVRESSLRRWHGEHWTADVDPPAAVAEVQPSAQRHPFNWPVLVATLVSAWWVPSTVVVMPWWAGTAFGNLAKATFFIGPPIVVLLGLLGTRRRYSTASRIWAVVPLLIGALGVRGMWLWRDLIPWDRI
jgi:hypothetical protein